MEGFSGAAGILEINSFLTSSVFWKDVPWKLDPLEWCRKLFIAIPSLHWKDDVIKALSLCTYILQFKYITIIHVYIYTVYTGITNQPSSGAGFQPSKDFAPSQTGTLVEDPAEMFMSRTQFSDNLLRAGTQPQANQQEQSRQGRSAHSPPTNEATNQPRQTS